MKNFSIEHPFFDYMGRIGDWMILNLLFVLTSLPVVTMGMSVTAMYRIALRRRRGENCYVIREYFQACKEEWKQSTKIWIIFLLTGGLLLFDVLYAENLPYYLNIAIGILVAVWFFIFSYAFALQARFENSIKNTLKNALCLSLQNLPVTLLMVLMNAVPVICFALGRFWIMMVMPVYLVIGFSFTAMINSIFLDRIFLKFMNMEA